MVKLAQQNDGRGKTLLDHVVAISSVSGGSLASANLVVNGPESLDNFKQFLTQDIVANALLRSALPWRLPLLLGDRASLYSQYLDETLLRHGASGSITFGELSPQRPFLILSGADISAERSFGFTQEGFKNICSDVSKFPVSMAVAASGALPYALTDVELFNYQGLVECPLRAEDAPGAADNKLYSDKQAFLDARYERSLWLTRVPEGSDQLPFRRIEFVHLLDGGITDNLALRPLLRLFGSKGLQKFAGMRILYIQVNARSDPPNVVDHAPGSPGLLGLFTGVPYSAIDTDTALTSYLGFMYWNAIFAHAPLNDRGYPTALYYAEIDFDQDRNRAEQTILKNMTELKLNSEQVNLLHNVAGTLLEAHPCFRAFLHPTLANTDECGVMRPGHFAFRNETPPAVRSTVSKVK